MTSEHWARIKRFFDFAFGVPATKSEHPSGHAAAVDPATSEAASVRPDLAKAAPLAEYSLIPGELVSGRYRITRIIGRGGMGEVFEAKDQFLNEAIALKTLRADLAQRQDIVKRFQKEIQFARKVTHPNVCRIFETGLHEPADPTRAPLPYFTMELLTGETLSQRIRRVHRLSRDEAFPIAVQMAEGLQAAHTAGIVHADFKSGNVILVPGPQGERAVITDFGLARVDPVSSPPDETHSMSEYGPVVGTVAYMSPEQMAGGTVSAASDIYSYGIVLFEMATGKLPFDESHVIHAAMQRGSDEGIKPRSLVPDLDSRWDVAIGRCLQKKPQRRFPSARAVADWFRDDTWRMPRLYWTRREWIPAIAGVGVTATVVAGYFTWYRRPYQPTPAALDWYQKGIAALHSMTYEAARRAFEQSVANDSGFALAHAGLARANEELDYSDLARESLLRAVTLAQESRLSRQDAQRVRALQFLVSRDYDRAAPLFQQLEAAAPARDKASAALETGWLAQQRDDTEGAAAAYKRALQLNPGYAAAKLRLGYILGRRRQLDAALKAFQEAEDLYAASSDYEGVTQTLYERARLLNRTSRSGEAMAVIQKALSVAGTVGSPYQQISLQLVQAVATRNTGNTKAAAVLSQRAIDAALAGKMDNLATNGLIELGNSYLAGGDLASAEPVFRRALDIAGRGKVRRDEARARSSLASLCEQQQRPDEAQQYVEAALPFYRQAGYRREFVQAMTVLGGIHEQRAEFDEGVRVLREALDSAGQLQDNRTEATIRARLGLNLRDQGAWPEALAQFERAASLLGSDAATRLDCGELYWRLGRRQDAERSVAQAEELLVRSPNSYVQFDLRLIQARIAYQDGRMPAALVLARRALAAVPAGREGSSPKAKLIEAMVLIRTHPGSDGEAARHVIDSLDQAKLVMDAASARLAVAEALVAAKPTPAATFIAAKLVREALSFFEPRRIWESIWRAHGLAAETSPEQAEQEAHRTAARSALAKLRTVWPSGTVDMYLLRPDNKLLLSGMKL